MFDTDFFIQRIVESGTPEPQARAIIRAIVDAQNDLTTKRDLSDLAIEIKNEFAGLRSEIALNEKVIGLKFSGLYALLFAISAGVLKLVFYK